MNQRSLSIGSKIRYPLSKVIGSYQSRGTRPYQEDSLLTSCIQLDPAELRRSLRLDGGSNKLGGSLGEGVEFWGEESGTGRGWEPTSPTAGEIALLGIFDGHGGGEVSRWLAGGAGGSQGLAEYVEVVEEVRPFSLLQRTA